jgi:hypothetical protein
LGGRRGDGVKEWRSRSWGLVRVEGGGTSDKPATRRGRNSSELQRQWKQMGVVLRCGLQPKQVRDEQGCVPGGAEAWGAGPRWRGSGAKQG